MIFFMGTFLRLYLSQYGFEEATNTKPVVNLKTAG